MDGSPAPTISCGSIGWSAERGDRGGEPGGGILGLDRFLQQQAHQSMRHGVSQTFVLVSSGAMAFGPAGTHH